MKPLTTLPTRHCWWVQTAEYALKSPAVGCTTTTTPSTTPPPTGTFDLARVIPESPAEPDAAVPPLPPAGSLAAPPEPPPPHAASSGAAATPAATTVAPLSTWRLSSWDIRSPSPRGARMVCLLHNGWQLLNGCRPRRVHSGG